MSSFSRWSTLAVNTLSTRGLSSPFIFSRSATDMARNEESEPLTHSLHLLLFADGQRRIRARQKNHGGNGRGVATCSCRSVCGDCQRQWCPRLHRRLSFFAWTTSTEPSAVSAEVQDSSTAREPVASPQNYLPRQHRRVPGRLDRGVRRAQSDGRRVTTATTRDPKHPPNRPCYSDRYNHIRSLIYRKPLLNTERCTKC